MKKIINILVMLLLLSGCTLFDNEEKNSILENQSSKNEEQKEVNSKLDEIEFSEEEEELDKNDYRVALFSKLKEYGNEIYDNKSYTSFDKSNDVYFASLNKLEELGYDISIFKGEDGTICNKELSGIYFDIEYKLVSKDKLEGNPILTSLIQCSKEELSNN